MNVESESRGGRKQRKYYVQLLRPTPRHISGLACRLYIKVYRDK
jgi:hypothetical protein